MVLRTSNRMDSPFGFFSQKIEANFAIGLAEHRAKS